MRWSSAAENGPFGECSRVGQGGIEWTGWLLFLGEAANEVVVRNPAGRSALWRDRHSRLSLRASRAGRAPETEGRPAGHEVRVPAKGHVLHGLGQHEQEVD